MRQPLEEAFLTIKAALEQMAQADSHAAPPAAPAAAAQMPSDAAATTEAGHALLLQHQQQLALTSQQALLQQQQALGSTTAVQYQVGVAPPQTLAGEPDGTVTALPLVGAAPPQAPAGGSSDTAGAPALLQTPGRKKQAECTDEQLLPMESRSSRRAENKPY